MNEKTKLKKKTTFSKKNERKNYKSKKCEFSKKIIELYVKSSYRHSNVIIKAIYDE